MSNMVRATELTNALRTLLGYVDDLERASFDDGSTKLRLVVNYCQKDTVVRALSEQLRARITTEALHERALGQETLALPKDPRDRLAFAHTLLYHLKQGWKLELRELVTRAFKGAGVEGRWRTFQQELVAEYAAGLERVLRFIEERQLEGMVDPDDQFRAALAAMASHEDAATPAPSPPVATAPAAPEVALPVPSPDLLSAIDGVALPPDVAHDLKLDARLLAIELRKATPSPKRLAELERAFLAASDALGAAFRGALGGQTAYVPAQASSVRAAERERADDPADEAPAAKKQRPATKKVTKKKPVTKKVAKKKPATKKVTKKR